VLHTRSCTGLGMQFVRFLAACYLAFNMDFGTVTSALASLPLLRSERRLSSFAGGAARARARGASEALLASEPPHWALSKSVPRLPQLAAAHGCQGGAHLHPICTPFKE